MMMRSGEGDAKITSEFVGLETTTFAEMCNDDYEKIWKSYLSKVAVRIRTVVMTCKRGMRLEKSATAWF